MPAATNSTRAPGIGLLADAHPERRDGDKNTVVVGRRPRKADAYERSPTPISKQHKPEAAKQLWRDEITLLMKHNFTPEEKRGIKASFSEERKAIRKGGSDLASVRKELASKRNRLASEASKRGPERGKVKVGGGGRGSMGKRGSGNSRPKSNSDRNARKAGFQEECRIAHSARCSGAQALERVREREEKHRHIIYIELRKWANQNQGGRGALSANRP